MRIALAVNGSFSYLAFDGVGSANVAIKAADSSTSATLYAPYGGVRYSSGTMPTDYGFTGQHSDSTTGLDYYNARYYDPAAGQFTTADTVLPGNGYDILGLSRCAYVEGNPQVRTDPSGHCFVICAAIGAAAGAVVTYVAQVVGNVQKGESPGRALTDVSVRNILIGAAAGAVIGGTLGLATPVAMSFIAGAGSTEVAAGAGTATVAAGRVAAHVLEDSGEQEASAGLGRVSASAAVDDAAAAGGQSNFMARGEAFAEYASHAEPVEGYHDVIVHSSETDFGATPDAWELGRNFIHCALAKLLERDPDYVGGPIRLLSCNTGGAAPQRHRTLQISSAFK